jgi:hypothetical protein
LRERDRAASVLESTHLCPTLDSTLHNPNYEANTQNNTKLNLEISNLQGRPSNLENLNGEITDEDTICTHYINENNIKNSPQVKVLIQDQVCYAVLDTRCQSLIISEELYTKLKYVGVDSLELPTQHILLRSAFSGKKPDLKSS